MTVTTVPTADGGTIDSSELGRTLMHEHIFVRTPDAHREWDMGWGDTDKQVAGAVERLTELKGTGIDSIVDLTTLGNGRNVELMRRVAEQVDLNVVAATGWYTYDSLPPGIRYRGMFEGGTAEWLTEQFAADIEKGVADTGVRCGVLKCATDEPGVTEDVEAILRAVARTHRRTGVPISTHTHPASKNGLDQQRIFAEEGVDLTRVVIGHSGDSTDLDYLEALMDAGSYLGMDRFGIDMLCPPEDRVATVATLCERGRADQMVLSHDAGCYLDWFDEDLLHQTAPNWHFRHISHDVIPALKERGVTDEHIEQMLVANPRHIFETQDPYEGS